MIEIDHTAIADYLVEKGLFNEREASIKNIIKVLELNPVDNKPVKICFG